MIEDLAGQLIGGRYRIRELVGIGGMDSTVWKAWQTGTERVVAVKVLPAAEEAAAKRFARGARIAANLNHPNCTVVHDYGRSDDGKLFLVMEYLNGQVLQEVLGPEGMAAADTIHVADQVLQALEHAHGQRAVHRDLKPDNLFLSRKNDDPLHVKILDFGIAKYVEEDPENTSLGEDQPSEGFDDLVTEQRQVCGTPQYMAPEQVVGARIDGRTDLYSLGVVMYRMLTGRLPFDGKTRYELYQKHLQEAPKAFHDVRPDLIFPERLELIVMRVLSKRPDQRFQNAAEMRKALASIAPLDDRQRRGVRPRVSLKQTSPQDNRSSAPPTVLPGGMWTLSQPGPGSADAPGPARQPDTTPTGRPQLDAPPPLPPGLTRARTGLSDAELLPLPTDLALPHHADAASARAAGQPVDAQRATPTLAFGAPEQSLAPAPPEPSLAPDAPEPRPKQAGSLPASPPTLPRESRASTNILSDAVMRHPAGRSSLAVAPEVPVSTETEPNRTREAGEKRRRRLGVVAVLAGAFLVGVGGVALTMHFVVQDDEVAGEASTVEDEGVAPLAAGGTLAGSTAAIPEAKRDTLRGVTTREAPPDERVSPSELPVPSAAETTTTAGRLAGHALSEVPVAPTRVNVPVRIDSDPQGAIVSEGLTILGPTPLVVSVPAGLHVFTLVRDGFVNAIVEIDAIASSDPRPIARKLVLAPDRRALTPQPTPSPTVRRTPPPDPNKLLRSLDTPEPRPPEVKPDPVVLTPPKQAPQVKLLDDKPTGPPSEPPKKPSIKLLDDDDAPKTPQVKVLE